MKQFLSLLTIVFIFSSLTSCVESSKKYKTLLAQMDSLTLVKDSTSAELEQVFETLNEVENGLKSLREAENILALQTQSGKELTLNTREQMKSDVAAISEAIAGYKSQIEKLKNENRIKSAEFKKRLDILSMELEEKSVLIADLQKQLEDKDSQLRLKTQQIATLDQAVNNLRSDVSSLSQEKEAQKETIATQDQLLNSAFYISGTKDELITAKVLSKGGLFRSARISYEAEQSAFVKIDIRDVNEINLNAKRAKVLSVHPTGTYTVEPDENGMQVIKISSPASFWEQTKYLVIQIQ
jgi:DNA repair exonuclease SbcCD ATPase subunit